jgi:hypothetical protein
VAAAAATTVYQLLPMKSETVVGPNGTENNKELMSGECRCTYEGKIINNV